MTKADKPKAHILDLDKAPPVGTLLIAPKVGMLTLSEVAPYTRRDGTPSVVLTWQHKDGRRFTSGLRAHVLTALRSTEDRP